jgi:hypothetical protein
MTPPTPPLIDERQKALDKYKDRLLKHRCVRRRRGAAPACLALHAPVPGGAPCATVRRRGALHPHDPRSCSPVRCRGLAATAPTDAADLPVLGLSHAGVLRLLHARPRLEADAWVSGGAQRGESIFEFLMQAQALVQNARDENCCVLCVCDWIWVSGRWRPRYGTCEWNCARRTRSMTRQRTT